MSRLVDCCEPLFQLVCRLRRSIEHRVPLELAPFQRDMAQAWGETERQCEGQGRTGELEKARSLLSLFVNQCVLASRWSHAERWKQEAVSREGIDTGGEDAFVDQAERWLRSTSDRVDELLELAQYMIALGIPLSAPVRSRLWAETTLRLKSLRNLASPGEAERPVRVFPAAYQHTDRRDFVTSAGPRVGLMLILAGSIVVLLFLVNIVVFRVISSDLRESLSEVANRSSR